MANLLKDAIILPRDARQPRLVRIRHPDYSAAENTLLCLRALDDGGIDYDTALIACGIVTGNTSTGFFATRDAGAQGFERVSRPDDGILRGSEYFFQLPEDDVRERPYPVVPRFEDWTFPHDAMPLPWRELDRQIQEGLSCRITDCIWGIERAHIVPLGVRDWWDREELDQYIMTDRFSQNAIDASGNVIPLRSDIHTVFDDKVFAIVPKRDQTPGHEAQGGLSLVLHVVNPITDSYFHQHYHNRKLLPLTCSIECLFARFAWTIFSPGVLGHFLDKCITSRLLLVRDPTTGTSTLESRDREQVNALLAASRSRSASPRKRKIPEVTSNDASLQYDLLYGDIEDGSQTDSGPTERSPSRGRSRKRQWANDEEGLDRVVQKRGKVELGVEM
ncbi:hypothetical protein B0T25DRAFT_504734 [Lasiosphaeria hispida]|uniref:HNH nuclease domain-containing protein n=1 Tax=Lasiosphaeria hispida TaxID=260671 RepID=A0AAJ0MCT2_9PEZI|nr:hypothetical protein B0T25DRAFT_504734 [Lasiosphaeria hispida]